MIGSCPRSKLSDTVDELKKGLLSMGQASGDFRNLKGRDRVNIP